MLEQPKLILASASPRRQELLREAGIQFQVFPAHIPEDQKPGEPALDYAMRLAEEKATTVAVQFPQDFVLGADTIVVLNGEVLGKPVDRQDAARILRKLSGHAHLVSTAVSLVRSGHVSTRTCTSKVSFRRLEEREIQQYIAGGEPMDKAGAYAIQGGAAPWVVRLEGDYSNVVGLPVSLVTEMLRASGFSRP
jgi:nucleoside triphosphate pyrophosphatase